MTTLEISFQGHELVQVDFSVGILWYQWWVHSRNFWVWRN